MITPGTERAGCVFLKISRKLLRKLPMKIRRHKRGRRKKTPISGLFDHIITVVQ